MSSFRSLKANELLRILTAKPFEYETVRQKGSHRMLRSQAGYPPLTFSFHDGQTLPPGLVRKVLMKDVGLTEEEAMGVL